MEDKPETELTQPSQPLKFQISKAGNYPTRYHLVGQLKCFFFSWYKHGQVPLFSIGPSWPFTIILLCFGGMCCGYLYFMRQMVAENPFVTWSSNFFILINLLLLFGGICGDPGVKPSIYQTYTKRFMYPTKDLPADDLEAGTETSPLKKRKVPTSSKYRPELETRTDVSGETYTVKHCAKCEIDCEPFMDHCYDCDVCVSNCDHHCVFFSKCIG